MTTTKHQEIKELTFEEVFGKVSAKFDEIEDVRASNRYYELGDVRWSSLPSSDLSFSSLSRSYPPDLAFFYSNKELLYDSFIPKSYKRQDKGSRPAGCRRRVAVVRSPRSRPG
ncbi:MAG TPA: hypothetical protein PLU80_15450, partial [Acidobacteriota bacterium]|nr:hypothetical protein [Acidobacteriota bacterium]